MPGVLLELARGASIFPNAAGLTILIYTYPLSAIIGVPTFAIFEKYGLRNAWHYLSWGFLGMAASVLLVLVGTGEQNEPGTTFATLLEYAGFMGALAASVTGTFWLIAVRPRRNATPRSA